MAIDIKHPEGQELCFRLIERADVLIENFRPGTMTRLGLGYAAAAARNPRLIYTSISGYGQSGPWRDEPAMDLILQATAGLISITGTEDGQTARCGHSVADLTAGMNALIGILMALHARHSTGRGQHVDISMLDSLVSTMASNYAQHLATGAIPVPMGTAFATIVPYRTFPTADRDIAIAVASEKLWEAFCQAIDRPDFATDPRYESNAIRVAHRDVLEPLIAGIFRQHPAAWWRERLGRFGVPCGIVRNLHEVAVDPQAAHRELFPTVEHPTAGPVRVTGAPIKFSDSSGAMTTAAPLPGEHTRQALSDLLGLTPTELDGLENRGVIRGAPMRQSQ